MGLFSSLFGGAPSVKNRVEAKRFFSTLTAYQPVFNTWGGAIYESELVRAAIDCRSRHASKLKVEIFGAARPKLQTRLKHEPNDFQTWGQFLYRLNTILDVQNTAFIVPTFNEYGDVVGVYPIVPSQCALVETKDHVPYIRYTFQHGENAAIRLSDVGILTKFQYKHDFFGENNVRALQPTMELIDIQNQGIKEGVKSAATYRFMGQLNNFADDEDLEKERKRFNSMNFKGEKGGGILLFPNTYNNVSQIDSKPFVVDAEQMKIIQTNVFNYYGVNEDTLQNKAYGDKWSAFYEGAIEPFAIQFSETMTKMMFSGYEQSHGSYVMATANRLQYMSNQEKLSVSSQMLDRGIMSRNEVREIWNLPPIEDGDSYIIRGEYYDASKKLEEDNNANQEQ